MIRFDGAERVRSRLTLRGLHMASWFVPSIVVPFMLAALIVGCGLYRIYL
jgi:hypothetical protein